MRSFTPIERALMEQFTRPPEQREWFTESDPQWDAALALEQRGLAVCMPEPDAPPGFHRMIYMLSPMGKLVLAAIQEHNIT